ncbi:MAG TPA: hypothetical protein VJV05_08265, partial [Pyrinomonadaceae bacterium]|nr:hypothetical protein [Pyrinomonadaceae bacterium]
MKKSLPSLVSEMSRTKASGVNDLLLRLDVYKRAGDKQAIRQTVTELSAAPDLPAQSDRKWLLDVVRANIGQDLAALRLYYETLTPDDGYYSANGFISLWQIEGDEKELETWLATRVSIWNSWFQINFERRLKKNEAQPILNEMAARVRSEPGNKQFFNQYIAAVKHARDFTFKETPSPFEGETSWLGDIFVPEGALANYEFGDSVREVDPSLAIRYFQKSLSKDITDEEVGALQRQYPFVGQRIQRLDWQKQLRYWTKEKLAAAYQRTAQSHLAQPLIEELIAAKSDDLMSGKDYGLAGAVQAGSGARVVETKVLNDEAARAQSLEYWMERLNYYDGRNEFASMENTLSEALSNLSERDGAWFVERVGDRCRHKEGFRRADSKLADILLKEFGRSRPESDLAFNIVHAAIEYCDLNDVGQKLFVDRRDTLAAVFDKRPEWGSKERDVLETILEDDRLSPEQKNFYSSELERIVSRGPVERRLDLARLFEESDDHPRRVAQVLAYLKEAPSIKKNENQRNYAVTELFAAYVNNGQWSEAEKLTERHQSLFLPYWGNYLE